MTDRRAAVVLSVVLLAGPVAGLPSPAGSVVAREAAVAVRAAAPGAGSVVESWGDDSAGELGAGSLQDAPVPVAVPGLAGVRAVSAGDRFTLALLANGTVKAWGDNGFGQLGDGTTTYSALPVQVEGLRGVVAVAAGGGHALALLSDGTVMAWGDNQYGELGTGTTVSSDVPVAVPGLSDVSAVAAGSLHSMALLDNGTVEAWGDNGDGQLGDGTYHDSSVPELVAGLAGVTQIAAGYGFSLALQNDGTVRAWGENINGELGDGGVSPSLRPVMVHDLKGALQISAGWYHSLALLPGGAVVGWGDNQQDLPEPEPVSGATAVAAGGYFNLALAGNGTVEAWGENELDQLGGGPSYPSLGTGPVTVTGLAGVTAISAGANHAVALVPSASAAAAGPSAHPSIWRDTPSPNPGAPPPSDLSDTVFNAVSSATATDAWAVGQSLVGLGSRAVAAHWDGSTWTAATLPAAAGSSLSSVVDLAPGDAWAVGQRGNHHTLVEHWDGEAWTIVASPNPITGPASTDELQAVAGTAPDNIWAFGTEGNGNGFSLFYLHLVNGRWTVTQGPAGALVFTAAAAITSNDVWAAGDNADSDTTFTIHWNGTSWTSVPTPQLGSGPHVSNFVTAISATGPTDLWASGYQLNDDPSNLWTPYVLHGTGSGWTLTTIPTAGEAGSQLTGVSAWSGHDVWAIGQIHQLDGSLLTLTEHYNGTAWAIKPSLNPGTLGPSIDNQLTSVTTSSASDVLAVGFQEQLGQCCGVTLSLTTTKG